MNNFQDNTALQLIPGRRGRDEFKSQEDYERFRAEFGEASKPYFEKSRIAHALSEEAAMHRIVY
jgi:hypothetical protein